jgi:non-ribosomal peptide synthetase component F
VGETAAIAREAHFSLVSLPAERASYFSLECLLRDAGEGQPISGYFAWSTAALDEQVAAQLPQIYTVLLAAIVAQPDAPMPGLSLLSESARRQILNDWNDTAAPYPRQTALHDAFLAQAGRVPDAPALHTTAGSWSYARLEKRSAELAAELTVYCRSIPARKPTARRDFVMADAGVQIVLTGLHPVRLGATPAG